MSACEGDRSDATTAAAAAAVAIVTAATAATAMVAVRCRVSYRIWHNKIKHTERLSNTGADAAVVAAAATAAVSAEDYEPNVELNVAEIPPHVEHACQMRSAIMTPACRTDARIQFTRTILGLVERFADFIEMRSV